MCPGRLVDTVRGASAVRLRSTILRLWSESVEAGAVLDTISMDQAAPGQMHTSLE